MDEGADDNWYRRKIGRRIERAANRLIAGVLGAIGLVAAYVSLPPGNDDGAIRWLGLILAAVLFWLARKCLTARGSIIE